MDIYNKFLIPRNSSIELNSSYDTTSCTNIRMKAECVQLLLELYIYVLLNFRMNLEVEKRYEFNLTFKGSEFITHEFGQANLGGYSNTFYMQFSSLLEIYKADIMHQIPIVLLRFHCWSYYFT